MKLVATYALRLLRARARVTVLLIIVGFIAAAPLVAAGTLRDSARAAHASAVVGERGGPDMVTVTYGVTRRGCAPGRDTAGSAAGL